MKTFHLHLISDSTGETVSSVARAALAQFEHLDVEEHFWTLIRSRTQMEKVLASVEQKPGVVLFTVVDDALRDQLIEHCRKLNIPAVPILAPVIAEFANYLGMQTSATPGRQHMVDREYLERVEAVNFSLNHDDGQATWDLQDADIILVGVSRTSKSPTSMYLAFKGYKSANVPYVHKVPLPEALFTYTKPLIVGLTISPDRLVDIRRTRLQTMNEQRETSYVEIDEVKDEIIESRRLFARHGWPVIDVTRKSVEETAAKIVNIYHERQERLRG